MQKNWFREDLHLQRKWGFNSTASLPNLFLFICLVEIVLCLAVSQRIKYDVAMEKF